MLPRAEDPSESQHQIALNPPMARYPNKHMWERPVIGGFRLAAQ